MSRAEKPIDEKRDAAIGLVGVGLLGNALASRLILAGFPVTGWDVNADARRGLEELGGTVASGVVDAMSCPRVFLSLPHDGIVAEVLAESADVLEAGTLVIDTTTGDPDSQAAAGAGLAERGVAYLDATIAGSSRHVREGSAVVMAGGDAGAFAACRELLDSFASRTIHVGPCGSGSRMKLVVNLVLGLNRAALAEGLALAGGFGLDLPLVLECLQAGPARSRVMEDKGRKMINSEFQPQARLAQHLKDVGLILASGEQHDVSLPLSVVHERLLAVVEAAGFGGEDNSAVFRAYGAGGGGRLLD